ncbi:MAG: hypothetical protein JWN32_82 [Solirubrobacterales bacterium]|nr:hypothetical protein [Solirubrobacterales bacterium]
MMRAMGSEGLGRPGSVLVTALAVRVRGSVACPAPTPG